MDDVLSKKQKNTLSKQISSSLSLDLGLGRGLALDLGSSPSALLVDLLCGRIGLGRCGALARLGGLLGGGLCRQHAWAKG
jgi:hypothetical protein